MSQPTARDHILLAIRGARPAFVVRPQVRDLVRAFTRNHHDRVADFMNAARAVGTEVIEGDRRTVMNIDPDAKVYDAILGVAENGAVWLPDSRIRDRAALFLTEHVIVVLDRAHIVDDLHTAYSRVNVAREGFGMFMAGPSKTADIEQSLVIGAQGPKRLTLLLVEET